MTTVIQEDRERDKFQDLYMKSPVEVRFFDGYEFTTCCMEEKKARSIISNRNQEWLRYRYKWLYIRYKGQFRCVVCKNDDLDVLVFHHLDRKTKKDTISHMFPQCRRLQYIQAELKKCIVVCLYCHRRIEDKSITNEKVLEIAKREYKKYWRLGENIFEDFFEIMLSEVGLTIVGSDDDIKRYRIRHNFKKDIHLKRHPDYVDFCENRIKSKDPEVADELYRSDDLGEFDPGYTDWYLS